MEDRCPSGTARVAGVASCVLAIGVYAASATALVLPDVVLGPGWRRIWYFSGAILLSALCGLLCGVAGYKTREGRAGLAGAALFWLILVLVF